VNPESATCPRTATDEGLLLDAPLWENAMLGHQTVEPFAKGSLIDRSGAREATEAIVDRFDVRTPASTQPPGALSGGNQQKLVVGREIAADPLLLIAAHPTRGIDVGAQAASGGAPTRTCRRPFRSPRLS
jgi:simple sugar transport system ATP-binding protein